MWTMLRDRRRGTILAVAASICTMLALPSQASAARYLDFGGGIAHQHRKSYGIYFNNLTSRNERITSDKQIDWSLRTSVFIGRTFNHYTSEIAVSDAYYGNQTWLGVAEHATQVHDKFNNGESCRRYAVHCDHAHVRYNLDQYSNYTFQFGTSIIPAMICQELGHVIALHHASGDCMGAGYFGSWSAGMSTDSTSAVSKFFNSPH